jgi:hypothetical protein
MSTPKLLIVEGATVPKHLQITENGTAKDCSGLDLSLEISKYENGAMTEVDDDDVPTIAWTTQAEGKYAITEYDALEVGNYYARVGLTNGDDEIDWVPNKTKAADLWVVVPIANKG